VLEPGEGERAPGCALQEGNDLRLPATQGRYEGVAAPMILGQWRKADKGYGASRYPWREHRRDSLPERAAIVPGYPLGQEEHCPGQDRPRVEQMGKRLRFLNRCALRQPYDNAVRWPAAQRHDRQLPRLNLARQVRGYVVVQHQTKRRVCAREVRFKLGLITARQVIGPARVVERHYCVSQLRVQTNLLQEM